MAAFRILKSPVPASDRIKRAAASRNKNKKEGKRYRIDPTTCEIDYTAEELEFMKAMQRYKEENHRPFPTLKETLEVLTSLGYRKIDINVETKIG